jgi:hypothetical protein
MRLFVPSSAGGPTSSTSAERAKEGGDVVRADSSPPAARCEAQVIVV